MAEPPVDWDDDGVHARPRRTGREMIDMALAVGAIAISLLSLFVAVEHGWTERDQVAASTWPFPIVVSERSDEAGGGTRSAIVMRNLGNGAARFKSLRVELDGTPMRSQAALLAACCGVPAGATKAVRERFGVVGESVTNGAPAVLEAHGREELVAVDDRDPAVRQALEAAWPRLRYAACFCSVLGMCWRSTLRSTDDPVATRSCTPGADDYHD